jgi:hypothetical protein
MLAFLRWGLRRFGAVEVLAFLAVLMTTAVPVARAVAAETGSHPDFSGEWAVIQHTPPFGKFYMPADPPLSENGKKIIDEYRAKYDVYKYNMEPNGYCVEHGMPSVMWGLGGATFQIVQQPKRITLLSEATNQIRIMFLDGRKVPEDYPHTRNGYSVGHWEGDTLVVNTGLIEEWKFARWPHSDNATFVEKFSLIDYKDVPVPEGGRPRLRGSQYGEPDKVMAAEITMIDPDLYDKPASVTYYYRKLPTDDFFEDTCSTGIWWEELEKRVAAGKPVAPE